MLRFSKIILLTLGAFLGAQAQAWCAVTFCNKTADNLSVAIGYADNGNWFADGWYRVKPGACAKVSNRSPNSDAVYYRATNLKGHSWSGDNTATFCTRSRAMTKFPDSPCRGGEPERFGRIRSDAAEYTLNLTSSTRGIPDVQQGVIQERCLMRWHDSHQVHSVRTIVRWNYQAVKTKMKKLEHCVKIKVTGPVDVAGIAQKYVKMVSANFGAPFTTEASAA